MKKSVMITVDSKQEHPEQETDFMNFMTEGTLCEKGNNLYLTYSESEVTGLNGTTTTLKIADKSVTLMRFGSVNSLMLFEKGRRHLSGFKTEHGVIEIGVTAGKVDVDMNDKGGHINVEYVLEVDNKVTSYTTLGIKVMLN